MSALKPSAAALRLEAVRRASLGLALIDRHLNDAVASPVGVADAAGVPVEAAPAVQ